MPGIHLSISPLGKQSASQPEIRAKRVQRGPAKVQREPGIEVVDTFKQTESRPDGTFFFLDCPGGQYSLTAVEKRSGLRTEKLISVAEIAMKKRMKDRGTEDGYRIEIVLKK
ncbi:MAG: hypothetical protein H0X43_07695 [Nitrosospira sp.]|nr:hypothetical protein [Nitrosospira sp.]